MEDKYSSFQKLNKDAPYSFKIKSNFKDGSFLIFTPHGGGIEPGTTELCKWFNDNSFSYYTFSGIRKTKCKELHITSHHFDEPRLFKMLNQHQCAISFHGMSNSMKQQHNNADIVLGGLNDVLLNELYTNLKKGSYTVVAARDFPESNLRAHQPNNVTNRCISNKGVQIELSEDLRKKFFKGNYEKRLGRKHKTIEFKKFCKLIKDTLTTYSKTI